MTNGPVMLDIDGLELDAEDRELLRHPAVGGVILFSRNYEDFDQLKELCDQIRALSEPHLLIAVDQEGGRVQRFRASFTRLPPLAWIGRSFEQDTNRGLHLAREAGWLMATELRAAGVDFSFAPVLDLDRGISEVIGDRAFHGHPGIVADLAIAWASGARQAGMSSVGKHFPGHGCVSADSHTDLPVDERSVADIRAEDVKPFRRMIENGLEAIMPAHVIYTQADRNLAGFSRFWLQRVLREELGFQGVIFSDDLSMQAAVECGSAEDRAMMAMEAGCDIVLVCNDRGAAVDVVGAFEGKPLDPVSHMRCMRMHGRGHVTRTEYHENPRWLQAVELISAYEQESALSLDI